MKNKLIYTAIGLIVLALVAATVYFMAGSRNRHTIGSVSTNFRFTGSDQVVVDAIKDDKVKGVTCHVSYAQTGGISGMVGLAEDPSRFSIACRQTGPLSTTEPIAREEEIAAFSRSALFKSMNVRRIVDVENNVLVYLVYSKKIVSGSPFNSISSVPFMPWGTVAADVKLK